MKLKKNIAVSPLMISVIISVLFYIIFGSFNMFTSISMMGIFFFMYLLSSSIATIIFYVSYRQIGYAEKAMNIAYSVIIIMFILATIGFVISSTVYSQNGVNELLVITLMIMGTSYIILSFFNTGFPHWYRRLSIIIGFLMIGASGLCFLFPLIGIFVLIFFLCACKISANFVRESV